MMNQAFGRYTYFELSCQHGHVLAMAAPHMDKTKHKYDIHIDPERGRVFRLFYSWLDTPLFEFVIPDRPSSESTQMWRSRCAKEFTVAWALHEAAPRPNTGPSSVVDLRSATEGPPLSLEA